MLKTFLAICFLVAEFTVVMTAAATDSGEEFKNCARCHGKDGNSPKPSAPSIAGFSAEYIAASMHEYREGRRQCASSKMKCKIAAKWTDEEIDAASSHFAGFKRIAPTQEFDSALAATGKTIHETSCSDCHSAGAAGSPDSPPAGILNGQWREYLEYALEQYANGGRQQPDKMRAALESLDAAKRDALLNYYASGQ